MPPILATVGLQALSGKAEDVMVNTFTIDVPAPFTALIGGDIKFALELFYFSTNAPGVLPIYDYLGPMISRAAAPIVSLYDLTGHLDGSPHGSPVYADTLGMTGAGAAPATGIPSECAAVLTLRGDGWQTALVEVPDGADAGALVDRPRQRRSGRIYIGPFRSDVAQTAAGTGNVVVNGNLRNAMLYGAQRMKGELDAGGYDWCVWSRKDANLYPITHVQVDNAFDTQRTRGTDSTERDTLAI